MTSAATSRSLDRLLRVTSRSVYLTLKVVPRAVREQLGTAYLFCRAADTIADTRLLPGAERLAYLRLFRARFESDVNGRADLDRIASSVGAPQSIPEERELLQRLGECFDLQRSFDVADRRLLCRLVTTLTRGMELDLEYFPSEESGQILALRDDEQLDEYCYHVAGCVGEFWTDLQFEHFATLRGLDRPLMRHRGMRFGKGLQLTNILRDVDRDLAIGRCYLPETRLARISQTAETVRAAAQRDFLRPLVHALLGTTLEHYDEGWKYTLAIPRRMPRMRLACIWPLWIGLRTLERLASAADPCAPAVVTKIPRTEVRRLQRLSLARIASNTALDRVYRRLRAGVSERLEPDD